MKAKIEIELQPPTQCTEEEFLEWLHWEFGVFGHITTANPLCGHEFEKEMADKFRITIES